MRKNNIIIILLSIIIILLIVFWFIVKKINEKNDYIYYWWLYIDQILYETEVLPALNIINQTNEQITYKKNGLVENNINNKELLSFLNNSRITYFSNIENEVAEISFEYKNDAINCYYYFKEWLYNKTGEVSTINTSDLFKKMWNGFTKWKQYKINDNFSKYCIYSRF